MRIRARFWIALALMASWNAPAVASIGIGLHLAGHNHARQELARELAFAASHGHHHELDVAAHDHSAMRVSAPVAPTPRAVTLAVLADSTAPEARFGHPAQCASPPRTGPPELFYRHCALRL